MKKSSARHEKWLSWCFLGLAFVALVSLYRRLYLGVSLADESFYTALSYRFALGDKPFVDEWFISQTAALLAYPFVAVYQSIAGNAGIMLFSRHLYFMGMCGLAITTGLLLQKRLEKPRAWFCASFILLFIPHGIPNLSYNSLGALFFGLGVLASLFGAQSRRARHFFAAAGACHALAVYAYPPLVCALVVVCLVWITPKQRRWQRLGYYISGGIFAGMAILVLVGAGWDRYENMLKLTSLSASASDHDFGSAKLVELAKDLFVRHWIFWLVLGMAVGFRSHRHYRRNLGWFFLFYVAFVFGFTRASQGGGGVGYFVLFISLGGLFLNWSSDFTRRSMIPLIAAGICMSWASNNGLDAAAVALGLALSFFAASTLRYEPRVPAMLAVLLLFAVQIRFQQSVFGESQNEKLTARMEIGPFKGLYTTPEKRDYLRQLDVHLSHSLGTAKKILFYPHFPAGYLMTELRPVSPVVWETCPSPLLSRCREYFDKHVQTGDIIVRVNRLYHSKEKIVSDIPGSHAFDPILMKASLIWENSDFAVYRWM